MEESDSTYRISGLYITPNWNSNSGRIAMSCGIGAYIKVLRKVSINGKEVVIAADAVGTMARSWNMIAKNTILRTTAKVYLYARVERDGLNGMYIWSANIYNIDGTTSNSVTAVNNDRYYYIRVGSLGEKRTDADLEIDEGQYGVSWGDGEQSEVGYSWSDLIAWDRGRDLLVFLKTIAGLAIEYIILAGRELRHILIGADITRDAEGHYTTSEYAESDNAVVTGGFLKEWVNVITGKFIRKDRADSTPYRLSMGEAVSGSHHTTRFVASSGAMDGVGAGMWMLDDGTGIMETDLFYVRRAAYFRSLTIAEVKHMGGEVILSAAACQIAYVVPYYAECDPVPSSEVAPQSPAFYRCYFEKQANGRKVYNEWQKDDQARCQRFDANGNEVDSSFYWRLVVNVGEDDDFYYVDLSNEDYAEGSNPPKPNDNIVLFGHRNPENHDRTCAQMYSTVGVHAPSRAYYEGITSYDLSQALRPEYLERDKQGNVEWYVGGKDRNEIEHYIKYNTRTGLDIRTSSMTIIADGQDVDVADALGENFSFHNSNDAAPVVGGKVAEIIPASEIDPSDGWSIEECDAHVGDYLITSDGFSYELTRDDSGSVVSHEWRISSDRYLIHAQEDALFALMQLDDMADDDKITPQEKLSLKAELENVTNEVNGLVENLLQAGSYGDGLRQWLDAFTAIVTYVLTRMEDTTLLRNDNGEYLTVYLPTPNSIAVVSYSASYDQIVGSSSPAGKRITFRQCYANLYMWISNARKEFNATMMSNVSDILAGDRDINAVVNDQIAALQRDVSGYDRDISVLKGSVAAIANNVVYTEPITGEEWNILKGMIATDTFASLFATATDADGNVTVSSKVTTFVTYDPISKKMMSGVSISADQIDLESDKVSIFTGAMVIDSDGLKLANDGSVSFSGNITAGGQIRMKDGNKEIVLDNSNQTINFKYDNQDVLTLGFDGSEAIISVIGSEWGVISIGGGRIKVGHTIDIDCDGSGAILVGNTRLDSSVLQLTDYETSKQSSLDYSMLARLNDIADKLDETTLSRLISLINYESS